MIDKETEQSFKDNIGTNHNIIRLIHKCGLHEIGESGAIGIARTIMLGV